MTQPQWNNDLACKLREPAYNPASRDTAEQRDSFLQEYKQFNSDLRSCLITHLRECGQDAPPEHCFAMNNHPYGGSRFVQIEVLKKCLWSLALLQKIADIVNNFKTSYAVEYSQDIEDEWLDVSFFVITSDQIVAYFANENEACAFGVRK